MRFQAVRRLVQSERDVGIIVLHPLMRRSLLNKGNIVTRIGFASVAHTCSELVGTTIQRQTSVQRHTRRTGVLANKVENNDGAICPAMRSVKASLYHTKGTLRQVLRCICGHHDNQICQRHQWDCDVRLGDVDRNNVFLRARKGVRRRHLHATLTRQILHHCRSQPRSKHNCKEAVRHRAQLQAKLQRILLLCPGKPPSFLNAWPQGL